MLLAVASEKVVSMQDAAGIAAYAIVKDSVFGALLVAAVALLVWLIRRVLAIQDLRVDDQKQMSERLEKAQERQGQIIEKMTEAFSAFKSSIDRSKESQDSDREAVDKLSTSVTSMRSTLDSVLRDAVRGRSHSGGYSVTGVEPPRPRKS